MLLQGYRAHLCLSKAWQAAQLAPILFPHDRLSLAIHIPKSSFEGSLLLPFPSVTCVQAAAQRSVLEIVLTDLGAGGLPQRWSTAPARGVLGFGFSSPALEMLTGETEWEAGGSPYTWHRVVFLPGSGWLLIPFMSCHWCGSSGLVYSVSHQMHERQAAAGMGCIHLCWYPTVLGTASACRAGSVDLIFALAA